MQIFRECPRCESSQQGNVIWQCKNCGFKGCWQIQLLWMGSGCWEGRKCLHCGSEEEHRKLGRIEAEQGDGESAETDEGEADEDYQDRSDDDEQGEASDLDSSDSYGSDSSDHSYYESQSHYSYSRPQATASASTPSFRSKWRRGKGFAMVYFGWLGPMLALFTGAWLMESSGDPQYYGLTASPQVIIPSVIPILNGVAIVAMSLLGPSSEKPTVVIPAAVFAIIGLAIWRLMNLTD